jgi:hypothetical protein
VSTARARRGRGSAVHDGLVGPRKLVGTPYLANPDLRDEYARDIAPRTEAALARILDEVYGPIAGSGASAGSPPAALVPLPRAVAPARAIDLGSGTGAVGRALCARFGESLPVIAVDALAGPGVLRADLAFELPPVDGRSEGRFDLIVAAHLLNELFVDRPPTERAEPRTARVLAWSKALLGSGGVMILLEPALRQTSRELLAIRDRLLTAGMEIVAPCFWTGPCPALARERDWCHDAAPIANGARVDYSYLVLRAAASGEVADRNSADTVNGAADPALFRIVSDPMVEKGRLRLFGCGPAGRHPLVRLDRHTSPQNAPFDTLHRGSITRISPTQLLGDGLRLSAESVVQAIPPP